MCWLRVISDCIIIMATMDFSTPSFSNLLLVLVIIRRKFFLNFTVNIFIDFSI